MDSKTEAATPDSTMDASIFQSALPNAEKLEQARTQLLDLSARNRLLNMPRSSRTSSIAIVDEKTSEVYRLLVREGKAFTFLAGKAATDESDNDSAADDAKPAKDSDEI